MDKFKVVETLVETIIGLILGSGFVAFLILVGTRHWSH